MVTRIDGHLFHHLTPIRKATGADRHDGFDWNDLVSEFDKIVIIDAADSPFTPNEDDTYLIANCTSGAVTIAPSAVSGLRGKEYIIIKIDSTANAVTFDPNGSEMVNGAANTAISAQYDALRVKATDSEWLKTSAVGAGEANTGANVGTGTGLIFRDKSGVTLNFKSLIAGSGVTITNNANDIEIAISGGADSKVNVFEGGVQVGGTSLELDFDASDFNVVENAGQADVSLNYGTGAGQPAEGNHTHAAADVVSGQFAMARLASGTPNGSKFIRDDGTLQVPPGGSGGTATGFRNADDEGAVHNGTTNDATAINSAKSFIAGGKFVLTGGYDYGVSAPIIMNANYLLFDAQHGKLKCLSAHSGNGVIELDAGSGDGQASRLYLKLKDVIVDLNNKTDHPHALHCNIYTGGSGEPRDKIFKGLRIDGFTVLNHNTKGKSIMKLRNLENGGFVRGVHAEGIVSDATTPTIGIDYADEGSWSGDSSTANHGNTAMQDFFIAPANSATNFIGMKVAAIQFLNRVQCHDFQFFNYGADTTDKNIALVLDVGSSGGAKENRLWEFYGFKAEDWAKAIVMQRSSGSAGVWGVHFFGGLLEDKHTGYGNQGVGQANERTLVTIGPGFACKFIGMKFMSRAEGSTGDVMTAFNVASSTERIDIVNCEFFLKGTDPGTFNRFNGLAGKDNIYISNCDGYNPVGVITNPWSGAGTSAGLYNVSATATPQAFPKSNSVYTVRQTAKRITISGGTVSQIQINGTTIGQTAGSWLLEPGETIKVTHTVNPTGVVYCK